MVCGCVVVICETSFTVVQIIVLLDVKEVVILDVMVIFSMNLTFDHECHVAEGQADEVPEEQPGIVFAVASMAIVKAELQAFVRTDSVIVIDLLNIEACQPDALSCKTDVVFLREVSLSLRVPKYFQIQVHIKTFNFVVILYIPGDNRFRGQRLLDHDSHEVVVTPSSDLLYVGLLFFGVDFKFDRVPVRLILCFILDFQIPNFMIVPEEHIFSVYGETVHSMLKM